MSDKHQEWLWAFVGGLMIWLIGEFVATILHVQAMKKFSVCPYATQINKGNPKT